MICVAGGMRVWILLCAVVATLAAGEARAAGVRGNVVKVVVHGGSVSAFGRGGYGQWLHGSARPCREPYVGERRVGVTKIAARSSSIIALAWIRAARTGAITWQIRAAMQQEPPRRQANRRRGRDRAADRSTGSGAPGVAKATSRCAES